MSVILSGTAPEQNMSYPDYSQTPLDHQSLLVVVRHIGKLIKSIVIKIVGLFTRRVFNC